MSVRASAFYGEGKGATGSSVSDPALAVKAANAQSEHILLSNRDSQRVLDFLENPPAPNAKLLAAAHALLTIAPTPSAVARGWASAN